jgi:putative ATPase
MTNAPLAEQLRPSCIEEIVGQQHLTGKESLVQRSIESGRPLSILLWGPPGCGKTTLARAYAHAFEARFVSLSAVFSGVADLKKVIADAEAAPLFNRQTVLFVDEIHRFNKSQQDAFLPYLERGTFILIGATTENPSFSLNDALLSRMRVLQLRSLDEDALGKILHRYQEREGDLPLTTEGRSHLLHLAQGDGRYLLNLVENIAGLEGPLDQDTLDAHLQKRAALFDKSGDGHFNLVSALHKAVRGSDPDASLYWFTRMLEGGEEPLFIARRLVRMALEDVGLADPNALSHTIAARDAFQQLGSPEGELALAQAVVYLALAPKSNAVYTACKAAKKTAARTAHLLPPAIILNAPTKLMKQMDYGKGYRYDHDTPNGFSGQNYFPDRLAREKFYHPVERGFERELSKRITYFDRLRDA